MQWWHTVDTQRAATRIRRRRNVVSLPASRLLIITCTCLSLTGLSACQSPTHIPATSTPASSTSVKHISLTAPGAARTAINALLKTAGTDHVIKVDISAVEASLSIVRDGEPLTWSYVDGIVSTADSDIADVQQTSFNPADFRIDDLGALFATAAKIAGSTTNQQLQIVEYNQGQVLMTVTTNPESSTVFFRPDGTVVDTLDFASTAGITEALRDCLSNANSAQSSQVTKVGYKPDVGLFVDAVGSQPGTIAQATRPSALPVWSATFKSSANDPFDASLIKPEVIASLISRMATLKPTSSPSVGLVQPQVTWTVERPEPGQDPVIRIDGDAGTKKFSLSGDLITD